MQSLVVHWCLHPKGEFYENLGSKWLRLDAEARCSVPRMSVGLVKSPLKTVSAKDDKIVKANFGHKPELALAA